MQIQTIKNYCLSKRGAYEDCPFGEMPICYKLNGKIFAQLYPQEYDYKITLKCTADAGQFYRMAYPGQVVRGYHCPPVQQPYWNTIYLNDFSEEEEGQVFWIDKNNLRNYVLADGFESMFEVFEDDTLSENYWWLEENEWREKNK